MDDRPSKANILGALSSALDLVEGQPEGHALRTAQIALRIAESLNLTDDEREDLYFAAVLKDSGCSNNSVRIQMIFGGDEHLSKKAVKLIDWTSATESLKFAWIHTEAGQSLTAKLRRMASNIGTPAKVMDEVTLARCTRGAAIAKMLSFRPAVADAVYSVDEHWDGRGAATKISGDRIPVLGRILCFAQTFEVFLTTFGLAEAMSMAKARSNRWFDPEIVRVAETLGSDHAFFATLGDPSFAEKQLPHLQVSAVDSDVDAICQAFAMIVDAKSSFTSQHSSRVTTYCQQVGRLFEFDEERLVSLRRASLLHDIGKLGVPTGILEKPGRLEAEEFDRIKLHAKFGHSILGRIPSFGYLAEIASSHHERLDGKGYWRGLSGDHISLDVRIVTVCDVFDALSSKRPYREAMPLEQVWEIMGKDIGTAFDERCLSALQEAVSNDQIALA